MAVALPHLRGRATLLPRSALSDERLARLAADGDSSAFAAIFERYHQPLYRYCRSILRSDEDARDALQETMAAALQALPRSKQRVALKPWLYRIAHNQSISALRRRRTHSDLEAASDVPSRSAHGSVTERERLQQLVSDLLELSEQQRGALVMRELSGLDFSEIAAAFGVSIGAAKQTVYKARRSLADFRQGRDMGCDDVQERISEQDGRLLVARQVRAHLRHCNGCRDFRDSIRLRRSEIQALAPALAAPVAAKMLATLLGGGSDGGGAGGLAAALGGGGGKALLPPAAMKAAAVGAATLTIGGAAAVLAETVLDPGTKPSDGIASPEWGARPAPWASEADMLAGDPRHAAAGGDSEQSDGSSPGGADEGKGDASGDASLSGPHSPEVADAPPEPPVAAPPQAGSGSSAFGQETAGDQTEQHVPGDLPDQAGTPGQTPQPPAAGPPSSAPTPDLPPQSDGFAPGS